MIIKMDMAKAFDWVIHSFIFDVLCKFGFDESFVMMIKVCVSAPQISPLVNGARPFGSSRSLGIYDKPTPSFSSSWWIP